MTPEDRMAEVLRIETMLVLANAAERRGDAQVVWPCCELRHRPGATTEEELGPEWQTAAKEFSWVAARLVERGYPIHLEHERTEHGSRVTIMLPAGWRPEYAEESRSGKSDPQRVREIADLVETLDGINEGFALRWEPGDSPEDRVRLLDAHQAIQDELRRRGHNVEAAVIRENGFEYYAIRVVPWDEPEDEDDKPDEVV